MWLRGPTVTRYLVRPQANIRVPRLELVANDLAVSSVRLVAPVPDQPFVGIEVPNEEPQPVLLNDIHSSDEWMTSQAMLKLPLGKDMAGKTVIADLTTMPHLLVVGTPGSGKSVCLTSFITSLASENTPQQLRMILIDPKMVEVTMFNELPHLLYDVAVKSDQAERMLELVVEEMEERYELLSKARKRNIASYNEDAEDPLPRIVVVIDELAELMTVGKREIEEILVRLAQLARAVGIHAIAATQRPSSDVITGSSKLTSQHELPSWSARKLTLG
ncbi:MAG: DNA translocase FtsK [Chloroflexi bacterium]|nr:DNA translocase FtsK [Chloroflexota bacterium]